MSNAQSFYHRTFTLHRPGSIGQMFKPENLARTARELEQAAKRPGFGKNPTTMTAVRRPLQDAFEVTGDKYNPVQIEERTDQHFDKFATPWENLWSRLVLTSAGLRLFPVVDSNGSVVGHLGNVTGNYLLVAGPYGPPNEAIHKEAFDYYPMYVGTKAFYGRKDLEAYPPGLESQLFTVLTTVDGEVLALRLLEQNTETALKSVSLMEIAAWVSLAGLAGKLLIAVGTRGFRTLIRMVKLKDIKVFMDKSLKDLEKLSAQRRLAAGPLHPRVKGKPEISNEFGATEREIHSANRFAKRPEWDDVHLGDEARKFYNAPATQGPFPDVVARKKMTDGSVSIALSEGKGLGGLKKSIQQFEAAGRKIPAAENARAGGKSVRVTFSEQEVVVEKVVPFEVEGGTLISPGRGYGIDKDGFLLDATGFVDLKVGMPQRVIVNGKPIKVITMEYYGGPIHLQK